MKCGQSGTPVEAAPNSSHRGEDSRRGRSLSSEVSPGLTWPISRVDREVGKKLLEYPSPFAPQNPLAVVDFRPGSRCKGSEGPNLASAPHGSPPPCAGIGRRSEKNIQVASIMLVEDNPGDAFLVQGALAEHHVRADLRVLPDGEKAIQCVEELDTNAGPYPALVILDLNLPKLTGTEVLRRIRQSAPWNQVPVVILTSSNSPKDRDNTARLGANLYIQKPASLDEFMDIGAVLKSLLRQG